MLPDPLHPAVVHFPIVLMFLVPVAMIGALVAMRRGAGRSVWLLAVGTAAALTFAAWAAVQTGEGEEDRVERAVAHAALEAHEEPAERFLLLSGALAVLSAAGLVGGAAGRIARGAALAGSLVVLAAGAQVGHTGGELAYRHGAAAAYTAELGGRAAAHDDP